MFTAQRKPGPPSRTAAFKSAAPESQDAGPVSAGGCACGGGCPRCQSKSAGPIPVAPKLAVSSPGDPFEREADRMAERVMPAAARSSPGSGNPQAISAAPPSVHEVVASPGQPLDAAIRAVMEPGFGRDFSEVRVHSGAKAGQSAQDAGARAYTVGNHIVLGTNGPEPATQEGRRLIAHELAHVGQPGAGSVVRRDVLKDAAGTFVSYEFRVGQELTLGFVTEAQRVTADGTLDDADIQQLKSLATKARDTVSDHERMFLAGLLDAANVATLAGMTITAASKVTFPLNTITAARVKQVIEAGQPALAASVAVPSTKALVAFASLDIAEGIKQMGKAESAAEKEIRNLAGTSLKRQANTVISFAQSNGVALTEVVLAMLKAASDDTPGDRLLAATAYAVASAVKHPLTSDIRTGKVRMDALSPAGFARLPGVTNLRAAFVGAAPLNPALAGLKGDTIYMPNDFNIEDLFDRSTLIHELQHAQEDKTVSPTAQPTFPAQQGLEEKAYLDQAQYILDQMQGQGARGQKRSAKQVATKAGDLVLLAVLIQAKNDLTKFQPLAEQLFAAAPPPVQKSAADVATMLAISTTRLKSVLRAEILKAYGITASSAVVSEGQAGESLIHWIHRL